MVWIYFSVQDSITLLFIHCVYNSLHPLIQDSQSTPSFLLATTSLFSVSLSLFLLCHTSDFICKWYNMISVFQQNKWAETRKRHTDALRPPKLCPPLASHHFPHLVLSSSSRRQWRQVPDGGDCTSEVSQQEEHRERWALMMRGGCWGGQAGSMAASSSLLSVSPSWQFCLGLSLLPSLLLPNELPEHKFCFRHHPRG